MSVAAASDHSASGRAMYMRRYSRRDGVWRGSIQQSTVSQGTQGHGEMLVILASRTSEAWPSSIRK